MPSHFPHINIDSTNMLLPLCGSHHARLERSSDRTRLARQWAPDGS
jgi:hypothetical protein